MDFLIKMVYTIYSNYNFFKGLNRDIEWLVVIYFGKKIITKNKAHKGLNKPKFTGGKGD